LKIYHLASSSFDISGEAYLLGPQRLAPAIEEPNNQAGRYNEVPYSAGEMNTKVFQNIWDDDA
jgi:hypothetical protein